MKKIFLIMFCIVLLVGTVSALDITYVKNYDEVTQIVTIKSFPLIGRDISTIQLKTNLIETLPVGYQKVAEFEIDLFDDTYTDAFEEMVFINNLDGKVIERQFDYKYFTTETIVYDCIDNKTEDCKVYEEYKQVWKDFDTKTLLKGKVTIGIFTEVYMGDNVEWIPTLFGKKINEWATFIQSSGTKTYIDIGGVNYTVETFTSNGYFNTTGDNLNVSVLVIAGGGGGGGYTSTGRAGAGGAGGYQYENSFNVVAGDYNVFIGAGGSAGSADAGGLGSNSSFSTIIAIGGGYGNTGTNGGDGGSGGGCWEGSSGGIGSQGGDGGTGAGADFYGAGGGGGAGANGQDGTTNLGGDGGVGLQNNISGINTYYAGGGGGGVYDGSTDGGSGGLGGGGAGGNGSAGTKNGIAGTANTGGGGGGAGFAAGQEGGVGGSGIIIIRYITSGDALPIIALNTPIDNANLTTNEVVFGGVVTDNINLINVSLIIDDVYNETNTSGINNSNYTFTKIMAEGDYTWTYEACDNSSSCTNGTARSFTIDYLVEEGIFYNSTSYETKQETFIINVTTNGTSTTSAEFFYNDVSQGASTKTGTDTNANFSNTIQIPLGNGTVEFYWKITTSGVIDTIKTNQTVNETVFSICNATYTVPFLNVSFKDEADDSVINATIPTSNFIYYLGDKTYTKNYTYVNSTDLNFYYRFCATPNLEFHVDPYIQYKSGTDYPQRIYDAEVLDYTNTTTDLTLYLLGTTDGIYVTFQVINSANSVISGVEVSAVREISGEDVQVGIGTTGADGGVTLWLNPDFSHDFTFTKSGFTTYETSFAPTQSAYTITLSGGIVATDSYFRGITSNVIPTDLSLTNDTIYDFGFYLTSSFWDLTEYRFDLRLTNGTIIAGDTTTTSGTQLTKSYNVSNQTRIYLDYYWLINETYTNGTRVWVVYSTSYTQWSIATFFTDLDTYLDSGFFGIDDFGRYLIIFILIFFTIGIMSYKFGFTSPLNISVMTFLIIFFFDVVVNMIPDLAPFGVTIPNLLTFITGLIMVMLIVREGSK